MVIQPIYNILFLPDVTYHFKKEFFTENASEQLEVGSELLFAFLRNEDDAEELDADHICPVGISARVEAVSYTHLPKIAAFPKKISKNF